MRESDENSLQKNTDTSHFKQTKPSNKYLSLDEVCISLQVYYLWQQKACLSIGHSSEKSSVDIVRKYPFKMTHLVMAEHWDAFGIFLAGGDSDKMTMRW